VTPAKRRRSGSGSSSKGAGRKEVAPSSRTTPKGSKGRVPVAAADSRAARRQAAAERRAEDDRRRAETVEEPEVLDDAGRDDDTADPSGEAAPRPVFRGWTVFLVFAAAQVAATVAYVIAQSSTEYSFAAPTGVGAAVGQASAQAATGQIIDVWVPPPLWVTALMQLPMWLALGGIPVWLAVKKGRGVIAELGLRMKPIDVPVGLAVGVASQLLMVPALYWVVFKLIGTKDVSAAARELTDRATDPLSIVLVFVVVGIGAPVAEEIYFRGMAQRTFRRRLRPHWAILASAAFFAASHFQPLQFPALFLFGIVLGVLAWRAGRLGPALWAHVGFNVVTAATLVFHLG
jgi:hypothetical protein